MKKIAALLAALLALSCASALAEAYEEPILFRGIPWGTSYSQIAEKEVLDQISVQAGLGIAYNMGYSKEPLGTDEGTEGYAYFRGAFPNVAGYPINGILFKFAMTPDENGQLVEDGNCTALYTAYYLLKVDDKETVLKDLSNKLSMVYGDMDLETDEGGVWYGADDTMVALRQVSWSSANIAIVYGCAKGDDWLRAAQAVIDAEFAMNTEGL